MSWILATISPNSWCFVPIATQRVGLTLKSLILSPLLLGCCHSSLMLPLLLDSATPPQCCHSSSMLSFLLQCFHSPYYAGAISTILLILLQYCCSSINIAAPPSVFLLHLHVAIPPSTLTLNQCCHSFNELMFLLLPNINAPPSLLLPFLNVASTCNSPVKMNHFLLQVPPTGHKARSKPYPEVFDLFNPL